MIKGKIIKGIAGFYYVHVPGIGICECKAKGIFRKEKKKLLVGDEVSISLSDKENKIGTVEEIFARSNELIRPAVSNVDQALVIFAVTKPEPSFNLLDRFLIMMSRLGIPTIICFNKVDLTTEAEKEKIFEIYSKSGSEILFCSAKKEIGIDKLKKILYGKTTVVAGPSGVGKSSIINLLQDSILMETGNVSKKIDRGKHTTRHSELIAIDSSSYIMDTPGFSSLGIFEIEKEGLSAYYEEFAEFEGECRFQGCSHTHEPKCGVKKALEEKKISALRYQNYILLYEELREKRKY